VELWRAMLVMEATLARNARHTKEARHVLLNPRLSKKDEPKPSTSDMELSLHDCCHSYSSPCSEGACAQVLACSHVNTVRVSSRHTR
jgi:hypothetical protein